MEDQLLQSMNTLLQLLIPLQEMLKRFLYMEDQLLQSMNALLQLLIPLQEMLKRFL